MIAEFRFRNNLWDNPVYDNIIKELVSDYGRYYTGINAHARDTFRRRFAVDEKGNIGGRHVNFHLANPEFRGFDDDGSSDDDDMMSEEEDD